jgi:hypothetical protein
MRPEELGVDVIDNWDRFFPLYGDPDGAFDPASGNGFLATGARQLTFEVSGPDFDLRHVAAWIAWRDETNARQAATAR